ncbi:hypothetical protein P3L10_011462 [Capsicum annuum]
MPKKKLLTSINTPNRSKKKKLHKRKVTFEDDTSIFPSEILLNILTRLPVKSLLRFKSVSKPWNVMISSNEFKKIHRDQSKALGREKLLLQSRNVFEFRDLESSLLDLMENQQFPLKKFQRAEVWCLCDGLVLLRNPRAYKNYVLWNPSTREYRAISCPDNHLNYNEEPRRVRACGLCYDSSVGDYKVILIYDLFYAVYSLIRDSWTTKTSFPCPVLPLLPGDLISFGISTAGCVFWSLINGKIQLFVDRASTIIYFDVKSDGVKNLSTPDFVGENDFFYLASVKGCLSLYGSRIESKELNIWIMEQDGSWKWLMNICNLPYICKTFVQDRELLGCTRNGDIVFQGWPCCRIFIYYPRQQLLTETELSSKDLPIASLCLDSLYSPSLNVKHKRKRQSDMMFN